MRLTNIGILLLTAMVTSKYVISLYSVDINEGSFPNGITFDFSRTLTAINELRAPHVPGQLLAANTSSPGAATLVHYSGAEGQQARTDYDVLNNNHSFGSENTSESNETPDEPISMESAHTLVVYDITNPSNSLLPSSYDDVLDDVPLDNGNTIVSGLMMVMPRR